MKHAGGGSQRIGPKKDALMVTSDGYYRQRADVDRALKGHPPDTENDARDDYDRIDTCPECLAALRKLEGMTIKELAERAQISESEVVRIERGSIKVPLLTYLKLAKALGVSVEGIFNARKITRR